MKDPEQWVTADEPPTAAQESPARSTRPPER
ncbi:DUF3072 domain-containing protein [Micromonospora sp. NBC_00421]